MILNAGHIPSLQGQRVIVVGSPATHEQLERIFHEAGSLELVNPGFFPQEVGVVKSETQHQPMDLLIGEFSQSPASLAWKGIVTPRILPGTGDYIADWGNLILGMKPKESH